MLHAVIQVDNSGPSTQFSLRNSVGETITGHSLHALLIALDYIDEPVYTAPPATADVAVEYVYSAPPAVAAAGAVEKPAIKGTVRESDLKAWQLLGEGQSGKVFKAKHNGSDVAVKRLKTAYRTSELAATAMADLMAELEIMQALPWHENVVAWRGTIVEPSGALTAIVSEFCSGGSLLTAIQSKAWTKWKSTKLRIALGVARAVEHLHAHGVVHRDLAARNVLLVAVGSDLLPKVADFGMSRVVEDASDDHTTVSNVGPVRWMAPEQLQRLMYSSKSDAYAFGCVVFELFMRTRPWNEHVTLAQTINAVSAGARPEFSAACKIPRALLALVKRCWAHVPADRPPMSTVREELEAMISPLAPAAHC